VVIGPRPVQQRARETIERALDATIALLATVEPEDLRLADVTERSGVSAGSLAHHFGGREGLLVAAQAVRFERAALARMVDIELVVERSSADGRAAVPAFEVVRALAAAAARGERDTERKVRFETLAFARRRPDLLAFMVDIIGAFNERVTPLVGRAQEAGVLRPELSASVVGVFGQTFAAGRFVDELVQDALPSEAWETVLQVAVAALFVRSDLPPAHFAPLSGSGLPQPASSADALEQIPHIVLDSEDEQRLVRAAIAAYRAGGVEAIVVEDLRQELGLSSGWFSRHFISREYFIELILLELVTRSARVEVAGYEAVFDAATGPEDLVQGLTGLTATALASDFVTHAWDRLELIATASRDPDLRSSAGSVVRVANERIALAMARAQRRGVMRDDVDPSAVARFAWGFTLGYVIADLSAVDRAEVMVLVEAVLAALIGRGAR